MFLFGLILGIIIGISAACFPEDEEDENGR